MTFQERIDELNRFHHHQSAGLIMNLAIRVQTYRLLTAVVVFCWFISSIIGAPQ